MQLQRVEPRNMALIGGAFALASLFALMALTGRVEVLFAPTVAWAGAWVLTRPWGVLAIVAPAFLFPYGLGPIPWAATLLMLAAIWWWFGAGHPPVSRWALGAVGVLAATYVVQAHDGELLDSINVPLLWLAGILIGSGLVRIERAVLTVAAFSVPLALLALWEVSGGTNYWADATGATERFGDLATIEGAARALSTFGHPLIAGNILAVVALLALTVPASRWRLPIALVLAVGVVATVSRSSLLGLGAGLVVFVLLQNWRRAASAALAVVAIVAAVWLAVRASASLSQSFDSRFADAAGKGQPVREFGRDRLVDAIVNPFGHLIGDGFQGSMRYMDSIGGIDGFRIFDNWYPTAIYDLGWLPLLAAFALFAVGFWRADPRIRRLVLPAFVCAAVVVFFTDGVYWFSWRLVSGLLVGALLAPALASADGTAPEALPRRDSDVPVR